MGADEVERETLAMHVLSDEAIGDLPPELTGGLTFHLPMELVALRDAGASAKILTQRTSDRLAEAYAVGLVDPPMYRWALDRYAPTARDLLSDDPSLVTAALRDIEPLADGLAGAAFHGLIRLGYGIWQRDTDEVVRGLAYLRTRRQVLASPDPSRAEPMSFTADLPKPTQREGVTVFDLLDMVAGTGAVVPRQTVGTTTPRSLALAGGALVRRNPSSFVAVHAVTGLHGLCELAELVSPGHPLLAGWWRAFAVASRACTLLVESEPAEGVSDASDGTLESVVQRSLESDDTHDVKLAVALRRLVTFAVLTANEAVAIGATRLAATTR